MVRNLVDGLALVKQPTDTIDVFCNLPDSKPVDLVSYRKVAGATIMNRFAQDIVLVPWYSRHADAILFANYFTPPVLARSKVVTLIHDLQQIHFPENFSRNKRLFQRISQAFTLHRADVVVTPSEYCKRDLVAFFGSAFVSKILVLPNPISWDRYLDSGPSDVDGTPWSAFPYVLSVAAHYPHKNLETLVRAFAVLVQSRPEMKLVLVGQLAQYLVGTSRKLEVIGLIDELNLRDAVIVTGYVDDLSLGQWYRHASLFVCPSLFEGFGMPPVEALGMGIPVLTTTCGSLREVTHDMAVYIEDPLDVGEFASKMATMLEAPERYRPSDSQQRWLRNLYSPERIGALYYGVMSG